MRKTRLRKQSSREREKKALDDLFRPFVFKRANGRCDRCRQVGGAPAANMDGRVVLQVAHFKSRKLENTRWDPDNVCCLCKGCHFTWAHKEPDEFTKWFTQRVGAAVIDRLNLIWRAKRPRPDLKLMRIYILSLPGVGAT
jgi:hypothetical protein